MLQKYRINKSILEFEHLIYVAVDGNDTSGDGSKNRPFATYTKAESVTIANDAIIFGKGTFELTAMYSHPLSSPFILSWKQISIIGQGYDTILIANAEKYHPARDQAIVEAQYIKAIYRVNIKYTPFGVSNYNNAIFRYTTATLYNVAIENMSRSKNMSVNYYNDGTGGSLVNCVIKSNGRYVTDYVAAGGHVVTMKNCLFDWNYTNASVRENNLIRTVTEADIAQGTAGDLQTIGINAGDFAWYAGVKFHELYLKNEEMFGMSGNVFTKLADDWTALTASEKKALFESTNYETASAEDLATLGKFKVLTYSEMEDKPEITVTAAPKDQLILPKGFISVEKFDGIDKTTLTDTVSGGGACKLIVTTDLKVYQTYDFETQAWKAVDQNDLTAVKTVGINAAQFANITRTAWNTLLKGKVGLGIAYLIGIEATADKCAVDNLAAQVDMKGTWM